MNKLFIIYVSIILVCGVSCNKNIEKQIKIKAEKCDGNRNCEINISQLTNFSWDRMFVFDSPSNIDVIENALGVKYTDHFKEFTRPIIFMSGKKIVYYENNEVNIESMIDGQVLFDYPDSLSYQIYTPNTANFKVIRKAFGPNKTYFLLRPV